MRAMRGSPLGRFAHRLCGLEHHQEPQGHSQPGLLGRDGRGDEQRTMVIEGDTDSLAIPTLMGPKARRNLDPALKAAIASEAATRKVVRSCTKVVGALGHFAGRLSPLARGSAHKLQVEVPKAYLSNAIAHYRGTD